MQPGKHTLLQIPRNASVANTLLRVQAAAEHSGVACADMYFKAVNITGAWADARQMGGYSYASDIPGKHDGWQTFGHIDIKVTWGHTDVGTTYLNFFVRHLKQTGYDVGGILGADDYREAAKPSANCESVVMLHATSGDKTNEMTVAVADM